MLNDECCFVNFCPSATFGMVSGCLRDEYQHFVFIFTLQMYDNNFKYAIIQPIIFFLLRLLNYELFLHNIKLFLNCKPFGWNRLNRMCLDKWICNLQFAIFRPKPCCNTLTYSRFCRTVWKNCKLQIHIQCNQLFWSY